MVASKQACLYLSCWKAPAEAEGAYGRAYVKARALERRRAKKTKDETMCSVRALYPEDRLNRIRGSSDAWKLYHVVKCCTTHARPTPTR